MRALRGLRLHTRAKRQRQKARSEISVGNDEARAAKSEGTPQSARAAQACLISRGMEGNRAIASLSSWQGLADGC